MGELRSYGTLRLTVVAAAFLFVIGWAGVALFLHLGSSNEPKPAGTQQQIAAAQQLFTTLPAVSGATVDRYDSACRQPRSYCLVSSKLTPESLMPEALALLKTQGATVDSSTCDKATPWRPPCSATLHWRGARLRLASNAYPTPTGAVTEGTTLMIAVDQYSSVGGHPATPLPAWSALDPLPTTWPVSAPCIRPSSGGCLAYFSKAETPAPGPGPTHLLGPAPFTGQLKPTTHVVVTALEARGYSTSLLCSPATNSRPEGCSVSFRKYRGLAGQNGIDGGVRISKLSPTTVGVSVSYQASIG
jgi:hypothetical protein